MNKLQLILHIDGCDHRRDRVRFTSLNKGHNMQLWRETWILLGEPESIAVEIISREVKR